MGSMGPLARCLRGDGRPAPVGPWKKAIMNRTRFDFAYGTQTPEAAPELPPATDSFLRRCRSFVDLVVDPRELERDGEGFLTRIRAALAEAPQALVVNLLSSAELTSACIGVLLRARAEVVRGGCRYAVRPTCPGTRGLLLELGLGKILGLAA